MHAQDTEGYTGIRQLQAPPACPVLSLMGPDLACSVQMNEAALKHHGSMASRQLRWRIARTYDVDLLMKVCQPALHSTPLLSHVASPGAPQAACLLVTQRAGLQLTAQCPARTGSPVALGPPAATGQLDTPQCSCSAAQPASLARVPLSKQPRMTH